MNVAEKRIKREELYEAVWSRTIGTLAQEWNTTYLRVVQACEKMDVPRPGQGYWQCVARGQRVEKEPLPERTENIPEECVLLPQGARERKDSTPKEVEGVGRKEQMATGAAPATERSEAPKSLGEPALTVEHEKCDLPQALERAVLDVIRQAKEINFWVERIGVNVQWWELGEWIGLGDGAKVAEGSVRSALKKVRKQYHSFEVSLEEVVERADGRDRRLVVGICLHENFEWRDAWEEAWTLSEKPNPHCLSDNALRLFVWAKGPKNTGKMTDRRKIGAQAKLRKTYDDIEEHLREIRLKADANVQWEKDTQGWHGPMRIWFEEQKGVFYHYGPLNPALGLNAREVGHAELERFKQWLHGEMLKPEFPTGTETVGIFEIRDRKMLKTAFSRLPDDCGSYGKLPGFFKALRLVDGVEIRYRFENGGEPWLVVCQPKQGVTWQEIKARLTAKASEIPLEKKYDLSVDSRELLQWIVDLRSDEYLLGMTPPVEEHLERDIGIKTKLEPENVGMYVELLVEEINEKTEFKLRTICWHHYSRMLTRVLVKKKRCDLENVVRAVQALGLKRGKVLESDKVRRAINGVLGQDE